MAPKRQPHDLPPPSASSSSESESEHSSSSDDSDSEPQQLTQSEPQKPHQESSDSDSDSASDSSSDKTQKPPSVVSPEPKKPTSKSTQLKANGKRPAETEQVGKVSKSKKSKNVDKGSKSDEKVDKGSKSDKSKSDEKVDKGLKSNEKLDKGSKSDKSKSVEKVDKGSKKSKVSNGEEEGGEIEDKKTALFARLFTETDDIVLLEGMIDYKEKKGADPSSDMVSFHESVEDLLSCSVTKSQIADKIRRLKKKFMNNVRKGRNGEDPVISRPHEYKSFELSKKIWGSEVQGSEVDGDSKMRSSSRKKNKNNGNGGSKTLLKLVGRKESDIDEEVMDKNEVETEDICSLYPYLCASLKSEAIKNFASPVSPKEYVKKVVSGLQKEKARELEQGWEDFIVMEQQVYAKRVKMISEQAEVAMNVIQP